MFGAKKEYHFAVVNFQPSLTTKAAPEPLAVVVEGSAGDQKTVVIFGRRSSGLDGGSEVTRDVLRRLPDLLTEQVQEAVAAGRAENVLAHLGSANRWNIFVSPSESIKTTLPVQAIAGQLFGERVMGGPTSEATQAEFFVNTLLIPDKAG
jgi:hypothetical protein